MKLLNAFDIQRTFDVHVISTMDMCLTLRKLTGSKESLIQLIFHTLAVFIRIPKAKANASQYSFDKPVHAPKKTAGQSAFDCIWNCLEEKLYTNKHTLVDCLLRYTLDARAAKLHANPVSRSRFLCPPLLRCLASFLIIFLFLSFFSMAPKFQ